MNEIKAIETIYNGYRFRSRLEARWAVFFDALGAKYEYEPEGFIIPQTCGNHNGMYLPDFYLPDFDVYAEVKGSDQQLQVDSGKIGDAIDYNSTPMSEKGLILLGPIPFKEFHVPYFDLLFWHEGVCSTKCLFDIGPDFKCGYGFHKNYYYWFLYNIDNETDCGWPLPPSVSVNAKYKNGDETCIGMKVPFKLLNECYIAARQARFEHGETPVVSHE